MRRVRFTTPLVNETRYIDLLDPASPLDATETVRRRAVDTPRRAADAPSTLQKALSVLLGATVTVVVCAIALWS